MRLAGNSRVKLPASLQEELYYISENQEEKHQYSNDDFISVLFKELN
jgi:hypothetical protein